MRGRTDKEVVQRRTFVRSEVFELAKGSEDREAVEADQGQHVERKATAFCVDCVNLLYLDGAPRCAEFKFLIWPEALKDGVECKKQLRYRDLPHFKVFNGTANNAVEVVEELVLETIVSLAVVFNRFVTISEISDAIPKMNKSSIYPVLRRLMKRHRLMTERCVVFYPKAKRRKYWNQEVYLPSILQGRIHVKEKIVLGETG